MLNINQFLLILSLLISLSSVESNAQNSLVRIRKENNSWHLEVNGNQFYIKGVVGDNWLDKVKEYGGNSVRTGSEKDQLDKVFHLGLKALVNLPARAERDGMNYNDTSEIRKQTERIISIIKKAKDHPAVLMWAIGNVLDYIPPLKPFNPKVWDAVNLAAKAIHTIDPNHPVMTVIGTSLMEKVADIVKRCPDLDLLGINTYGDIYTLPATLKKYGWMKPYVITEWGPDGYWEVRKTAWGAPYEQTGREKYICYEKKYVSAMDPDNTQCLGSYVFYWSGFKQETTHTWFCMFDSTGLESPLVGLMHYLWTGQKSANEVPSVDSLNIGSFVRFQDIKLDPGSMQKAKVTVHYSDKDPLTYRWEIRPEAKYSAYAGQGEKVPQPVQGLTTDPSEEISFMTPSSAGAYRLFVYVYDGHGHFSTSNLPFYITYPSPVLPDTTMLGRYTSRTLHLLQESTSQKRNTVKILVYGQSISEQDWWLEVKRSVKSRFPYANLVMLNKSIGGFAAQLLYKTVEMDVSSFYPDLVLLHIYGDNHYYDTVLYTIRSRTAAEIGIMTDHFTGENRWSDTMSYHILPALAQKYKCDLINIRDPWKKYLNDHKLEPSKLTIDGTHLNDWGNFLMAELVKPLFCYKPGFPPDPFGLQKTYKNGKDFVFYGDTLILSFRGNRADLVYENTTTLSGDSAKVFVDGRSPSSFQGTYFMSRPYNNKGDEWPWKLPAMIRIRHTIPWVTEQWYCIFTKARVPYPDFRFRIYGSVTGYDGSGKASHNFVSRSGKVIIDKNDAEKGGDWHLNRSFKVLKTLVNKGDTVKWKTYSISADYLFPVKDPEPTLDNSITLFQGVPNTYHILKIVKTGDQFPSLFELRVYKPFLCK